jgi:carbonic anhydrase
MKGSLQPESLGSMPTVRSWLAHAEGTRWIARQKYSQLAADALLNVTIQENVLVQLENLRTHPSVAATLASGTLSLHAWVYKIETGEVFAYDSEQGQFLPLSGVPPSAVPPPLRLAAAHSI